MANKTRRQAVGLWSYLVLGDLTDDDPEPIVEPREPIPLDRVRAAIKLFCEVGSRQATNPYLSELELLGLATWVRGDRGPQDPGFVIFEIPDGPIPYLRPPSVVDGEEPAQVEIPEPTEPLDRAEAAPA